MLTNLHAKLEVLLVDERITSGAIDAEKSANIASIGLFNVLHAIRMHSNETRHFALLSGSHVVQELVFLEPALIDAQVRQLTVSACLEFERQTEEFVLVRALRVYRHAFHFSRKKVLC